jgi:hypothetical protein
MCICKQNQNNLEKNMDSLKRLEKLLQDLTGQKAPFNNSFPPESKKLLKQEIGLGHSQLNELLLLKGYDRISQSFFQYLVDGTTAYKTASEIRNFDDFKNGIDRFRTIAIFLYGNVKYAFKTLSKDPNELNMWLNTLEPRTSEEYRMRRDPVVPISEIPPDETFYLGYVIENKIKNKLAVNPDDQTARDDDKKRIEIVKRGEKNHNAYLASDHLDVYVATSMRERHEYIYVNRIIKEIFQHDILVPFKLRVFDPTQAYCKNRVDKGLSEALMLRRAACTIYLAQESDTFGKDSELASTLAQGKPVIAFVPNADEDFCSQTILDLKKNQPDANDSEIMINQLKTFDHSLAWNDEEVQGWIRSPEDVDEKEVRKKFESVVKQHFDKRFKMLCDVHPLGIQVHIETGVANGVLVVRTVEECAKLINRIVTNNLEFDLEVKKEDNGAENKGEYLYLKEKISGCVFRVVTGDEMLTNTFWNYYI